MSNGQQQPDITRFFIEDASEHLQTINDDLLSLENNQGELGLVDKIFRSVHAIKGSAGMAGFHATSQLAHKIEDLLGKMRSQELAVSTEIIDLLFQGVDALSQEIDNITDDEDEDESLLAIFEDLRADFLQQPASDLSSQAPQPVIPSPSTTPAAVSVQKSSTTQTPTQPPKIPPMELAERLIRQDQLTKAIAVYQKLLQTEPANRIVKQRLAEAKALYMYMQKTAL